MQTHGNEDSVFFFNDANTKQQQKKILFVLTLSLRVSSKNDMTKNQSKFV